MNYAGAGFILLSSDFQSVLLVRDARTHKWGFTKGHAESYDKSDLATAIREVREESGLLPRHYTVIDEPFKIKKSQSSYIFRYAILNDNERYVRLHPGPNNEIGGLAWVPIRELLDYTHIIDANLYLRTWLEDLRQSTKRHIKLYQALFHGFHPVQIPMSTCNIIACT